MGIIKLTPENFETFSLTLNPEREFSSSSVAGITGSINVFPRKSSVEKDVRLLKNKNTGSFVEDGAEVFREGLFKIVKNSIALKNSKNINPSMTRYLELVNSSSISTIKNESVSISRFAPDQEFNEKFLKKLSFKNLLSYYRTEFRNMNYGFTNYSSLNFLTASRLPENTALIYPNSASIAHSSKASGSYSLDKAFTFDFYINPRYSHQNGNLPFHAGTILHLSSSYALSLISGSSRDVSGRTDAFRVMLQVSHSADTSPSKVDVSSLTSFPNDLIFVSNDNSLRKNEWSHIAIRWDESFNDRSGSFIINNKNAGNFIIPSASIRPSAYSAGQGNPDALFVGNFYEGINAGNDKQSLFFAQRPADRDGLITLHNNSTLDAPNDFALSHPLNAEIHDLKIFSEYRTGNQIYSSSLAGFDNTRNMIFYVPPFFTRESPNRKKIGDYGGVLETPFLATDGTTKTPINERLSFRINVRDISLENWTRDFASGHYPRLLNLTSSQISPSPEATELSASVLMNTTGSFIKRNLTILPNDNGKFRPNYNLLKTGSLTPLIPKPDSLLERYVDDLGSLRLDNVSLNNLIPSSSLPKGSVARNLVGANKNPFQSADLGDDMMRSIVGVWGNKGEYARPIGAFMASHYNQREESSNEVVFFEISNLFFGDRIEPKSFEITDAKLSGSSGHMKMTLKDDGFGNLYRADGLTPNADFASVGKIMYNEGIVGITHPALSHFGKEQYEIKFKGEINKHILRVNVLANAGAHNSSSAESYKETMSASLDANEKKGERFSYLGEVLFMDDNFNVIAKNTFVQPILKRSSDRIFFKFRVDY